MGPCSGKNKKEGEKKEKSAGGDQPQQRNGNYQLGPEIFVHLKSGSISQDYKIDKVLGEGRGLGV